MNKNFIKYAVTLLLVFIVFSSNAAVVIDPDTGWKGTVSVSENQPSKIYDKESGLRTQESEWSISLDTSSSISFKISGGGGDVFSGGSLLIDGNPGPAPAYYIYYAGAFLRGPSPGDEDYIGRFLSETTDRETVDKLFEQHKDSFLRWYIDNGYKVQETWYDVGGYIYNLALSTGEHSLAFSAWAYDPVSQTNESLSFVEISSAAPVPLPATIWLFISGLAGLLFMRKRSLSLL